MGDTSVVGPVVVVRGAFDGAAHVSEVMVGDTCVPSLIVIGTVINQLETNVSVIYDQHHFTA